ncbi:MAG: penicillin-binding protein 2 [Alphaproteobacteria bacterium]|nr:penicillin-binding protein 2 [Alphaproteobacteria bacterium]
MFKRKETFYYPGQEIEQTALDKYRCLDGATMVALKKARGRISFILIMMSLCFSVIIGRLFYLTVMNYEPRQFVPSVLKTDFELNRKNFIDRHGNILATSLPTVDLSVNPAMVKGEMTEVAKNIVKALPDLSYNDVLRRLNSGGTFRYIKRNLTPAERNQVNWLGYYFLSETPGEKRVYPQRNLFSHLIGSVDIDGQGVAGLERSYNTALGQQDIYLSVDLSVQEAARTALDQGIKKYGASGGAAVVMDVNTAEVLAMVSLPDYTPNLSLKLTPEQQFNKASLGVYEFGSVFKLFNTAMALEYKDITPWDVFDATEPIKIGRKRIEDYRGQERPLMVPEILMHSSNIGTVQIAQKSGYKKQQEFLKRFGFYRALPIALPERGGVLVPADKKWADITSANVAFGYGISVSPLHLIAGVSALANGGYYRVPTFLKDGNKGKPELQVISKKTSDQMRPMMWAVVNWDLKKNHPVAKYAVGGKTGSANLIENGKYVKGKLRTTFVGVFPMNEPKYAVLVVLEDPQRIKETWNFNTAGWNAKPIALEIIANIAPHLGVQPVEEYKLPVYVQKAIDITNEAKKKKR